MNTELSSTLSTATTISLGETTLDVVRKDIKNLHLSVYPPTGRVRISAPTHMSLDTIRLFAISKLAWIRQQQDKLVRQERETKREFIERESHYVWGRRVLLKLTEEDAPPSVQLRHAKLFLCMRPGTDAAARGEVLANWYRQLIKAAVPALIARWEPVLGVTVNGVFVQQMKTKWGSCNPTASTLRLNTELAKKPKDCLEYIVLHEMAHLLEPTHGPKFLALMDRFMSDWRETRELLNRLPGSYEEWGY